MRVRNVAVLRVLEIVVGPSGYSGSITSTLSATEVLLDELVEIFAQFLCLIYIYAQHKFRCLPGH
jgi:hypothetical protein